MHKLSNVPCSFYITIQHEIQYINSSWRFFVESSTNKRMQACASFEWCEYQVKWYLCTNLRKRKRFRKERERLKEWVCIGMKKLQGCWSLPNHLQQGLKDGFLKQKQNQSFWKGSPQKRLRSRVFLYFRDLFSSLCKIISWNRFWLSEGQMINL